MRSKEIGVVGCEFHAGFKPMAIECVIATKTSDVLQAFQNTGVAGRELVGDAKRTLCPFIMLQMAGSETQSMGGIRIDMEAGHVQMMTVEHGQETSKEACMVDRKCRLLRSINGLMLHD